MKIAMVSNDFMTVFEVNCFIVHTDRSTNLQRHTKLGRIDQDFSQC